MAEEEQEEAHLQHQRSRSEMLEHYGDQREPLLPGCGPAEGNRRIVAECDSQALRCPTECDLSVSTRDRV
eukprot:3586753-Pyramimonas_sp.AAC.4